MQHKIENTIKLYYVVNNIIKRKKKIEKNNLDKHEM